MMPSVGRNAQRKRHRAIKTGTTYNDKMADRQGVTALRENGGKYLFIMVKVTLGCG